MVPPITVPVGGTSTCIAKGMIAKRDFRLLVLGHCAFVLTGHVALSTFADGSTASESTTSIISLRVSIRDSTANESGDKAQSTKL